LDETGYRMHVDITESGQFDVNEIQSIGRRVMGDEDARIVSDGVILIWVAATVLHSEILSSSVARIFK